MQIHEDNLINIKWHMKTQVDPERGKKEGSYYNSKTNYEA